MESMDSRPESVHFIDIGPKVMRIFENLQFCVPADELMRQQDGFSALGFWIKTKMLWPKFKNPTFE